MTLTYQDLYKILTEAEWRVENMTDAGIRERSAETVSLVKERLAREGLTRDQLKKLAEESTCDDCGASVTEVVGCPDGAEVCHDCFDSGCH